LSACDPAAPAVPMNIGVSLLRATWSSQSHDPISERRETVQMEIADSHQHFWHPGLVDIPWLSGQRASFGDPSPIRGVYLPTDYLRDAAPLGIRATVHVEAACRPEHGLIESVWATGVADAAGLPSGIVAYADLESADLDRQLDLLGRSPFLRGIRMRLNFDEPTGRKVARSADVMSGDAFRRGLRAVAARDLVFNLSLFSPQLSAAAELAEAVPEATLVLEHFGWPISTDADGFSDWRKGMAALAARRNVCVKVSGFWAVDREWREERIGPWVKETFALFGPKRCMFGSNLPIEKLMCPLPRQVEILSNILARETSDYRQDFFVSNAMRVFRLR
jgi:predicted TIM-barrel fold metal-dependent hydrolase